jgi:hypothetical protein
MNEQPPVVAQHAPCCGHALGLQEPPGDQTDPPVQAMLRPKLHPPIALQQVPDPAAQGFGEQAVPGDQRPAQALELVSEHVAETQQTPTGLTLSTKSPKLPLYPMTPM